MNSSLSILRETLKFKNKYLKEIEEEIQSKRRYLDQRESDKRSTLNEIADMERAITFLERVQ